MASPSSMAQGLLKRNPSLTPAQFSENWYKNHGALITPLFLYAGVRDYVQIHGPLQLVDVDAGKDLGVDITEYDGCASIPTTSTGPFTERERRNLKRMFEHTPEWVQAYYTDIILADEAKLLVSLATEHIMRLPPRTVTGTEKVVLKDGEIMIPIPERVWEIWREYERRGGVE